MARRKETDAGQHVDLMQEQAQETNNDILEVSDQENAASMWDSSPEPPPGDAPKETPASETETEQSPEAEIEDAPPAEQVKVENDPGAFFSPKQSAAFVVGLVDLGLTLGVPPVALRSEFNVEEREVIAAIESGEIDGSEWGALMARYLRHKKDMEQVPMTDEELKLYRKNWEDCFKKWNLKMTPEGALVASTLMIVGGRFLPYLGKSLMKKFLG